MESRLHNVAIIGAGLGGCALALALSRLSIPVQIYESRGEHAPLIHSGVLLMPNGLKVLDWLGVFVRIRDRCYVQTHWTVKNDQDETISSSRAREAGEKGWENHRIWRGVLLDAMREMLRERGVEIRYGARFGGFAQGCGGAGVAFDVDGEVRTASMLFGADGIHSSVRASVAPGIVPEYTGLLAVLGHIPWDSVAWPYPDYERTATMQSEAGAIIWIAEDPQGEEIMIGKQVRWPEQSRTERDALQADPERMADFYRKDYETYGATARKIIDSACAHKDKLFIWPFLKMPKMERWYGEGGRVVLLGDAAHTMPPSSGQGVNQALEDVYSLTYLLDALRREEAARKGEEKDAGADADGHVMDALAFWQSMRQKRIDRVLAWTENSTNVTRMPEPERRKLFAEGTVKEGDWDDLSWLHTLDVESEVDGWFALRKAQG